MLAQQQLPFEDLHETTDDLSSLIQASDIVRAHALKTIDHDSIVLVRLLRWAQTPDERIAALKALKGWMQRAVEAGEA